MARLSGIGQHASRRVLIATSYASFATLSHSKTLCRPVFHVLFSFSYRAFAQTNLWCKSARGGIGAVESGDFDIAACITFICRTSSAQTTSLRKTSQWVKYRLCCNDESQPLKSETTCWITPAYQSGSPPLVCHWYQSSSACTSM
jgi:hypothetical protein